MSVAGRPNRTRARRLADLVLREVDPLVAKQGFGEASLLMQWPEIVGVRVAALCQPERLQWPPRPRGARGKASEQKERPQEPATLILRVEPGFGLDIQHMAPAIVDRINAHLGWRCVAKLFLRQEPLAAVKNAPRQPPAPPNDPAARAQAEAATAGLREDGLREALNRLGERALTAKN